MSESVTLFIPGLACTGEVFSAQIAALSPLTRPIVADHTQGASIGEIAANILGDAPDAFALVGFSLGGYIAFEMIRQAPERITRLALLDTQAVPETEVARERRLQLAALVEAGRFTEAEQAQWPHVVHPSRYGDVALREIKTRMAHELGPQQWLRHARAIMERPDSRPTLASIRVPTLVLVGAEDALTAPERAREMVAGVADARLVVVPECGHMAPLERPEAVNAALRDWLNR